MTLNEFRLEMESYRRSVDDEARVLKDSEVALERLRKLYENFDSTERQMADQVLAEWALSEDEGLRFDGLALIYEFDVRTAIPALIELAKRLTSSVAPSAPYELKKIERILVKLKVPGI